MKASTAIELAFIAGSILLFVGLWLLAPWLALSVLGLLIMAASSIAWTKEPPREK